MSAERVKIITGDCRELMRALGPFDLIIADPPYGDTALAWDEIVAGWELVALERLKPSGSMWVFGSLRYFMATGTPAGFRLAQDVVWRKNAGSGPTADRFKRVHEHAVQFYRGDAAWSGVFNDVQRVASDGPRVAGIRNARGDTPHRGAISKGAWEDDGTRIMPSVIDAKNMRGRAIHPTEKPSALLEILIRTSCPPGGLVGDFFAGSGSAGEACSWADRNYVGAEIDPAMAEAARGRLSSNLFASAR